MEFLANINKAEKLIFVLGMVWCKAACWSSESKNSVKKVDIFGK